MDGSTERYTVAGLLAGVRLAEDPAREHELGARLPAAAEPRAVSVTDLLAPRRAFWRRMRGPAPITPERELRLERGRAWHRRLGHAVAAEGRLEVHVRRGGLSARIDLLADVPIEVKTSSTPGVGGPQDDRPDQVEQLAAYCALVGHPLGRLIHLRLHDDGPPEVSAADLSFDDLPAVSAELGRREAALRGAVGAQSPERLGRCRWFDSGCDYRTAGVCDCRGDERLEPEAVAGRRGQRTDRPDVAARWEAALRRAPTPEPTPVPRFRDLLYPRRAYFDRRVGRPPVNVPPRPPSAPMDTYERTVAALERGPVGDVHTLASGARAPEEEVLAWRGRPVLVRASRTRSRLSAEELRSRFPQYLLELGFRCAHAGVPRATLVVGRELAAPGEPPVEVFDFELPEGTGAFTAAWEERRAVLERAIGAATPGGLPSCPGWMTSDCPYRAECGCAADAERSHR